MRAIWDLLRVKMTPAIRPFYVHGYNGSSDFGVGETQSLQSCLKLRHCPFGGSDLFLKRGFQSSRNNSDRLFDVTY